MSVQFCTVPPSQKSGSPDVPQVLCDFSVRCALSSLLRSIWMVAPQPKLCFCGRLRKNWMLKKRWPMEMSNVNGFCEFLKCQNKSCSFQSIPLTFAVSMHTTCRQRNYGLDGKELTAEEHPLDHFPSGISSRYVFSLDPSHGSEVRSATPGTSLSWRDASVWARRNCDRRNGLGSAVGSATDGFLMSSVGFTSTGTITIGHFYSRLLSQGVKPTWIGWKMDFVSQWKVGF